MNTFARRYARHFNEPVLLFAAITGLFVLFTSGIKPQLLSQFGSIWAPEIRTLMIVCTTLYALFILASAYLLVSGYRHFKAAEAERRSLEDYIRLQGEGEFMVLFDGTNARRA